MSILIRKNQNLISKDLNEYEKIKKINKKLEDSEGIIGKIHLLKDSIRLNPGRHLDLVLLVLLYRMF